MLHLQPAVLSVPEVTNFPMLAPTKTLRAELPGKLLTKRLPSILTYPPRFISFQANEYEIIKLRASLKT